MVAEEWFKPEYAVKHNQTQMVRFEEDVAKENYGSKMVISGAQTHIEHNVEDHEVIWESGLTIVLTKINPCSKRFKNARLPCV